MASMTLTRRRLLACGLGAAMAAGAVTQAAFAESEQEARDMVAQAIALYDQKGDAAFAVFNEGQSGGFVNGEVYLVVQSRGPDAKALAHAVDPKLVGTPLSQIADPTGLKFAEEMSAKATQYGSWFRYQWLDPVTGKIRPKESWAVLHKDLVFIAGVYLD